MRDLDDAAFEAHLRRVLSDRLDPLRLGLTADDLAARATAQARAETRRRAWLILGLAAVLVLPLGWLVAGAPLPRPVVQSEALESHPVTTPTVAPSASLGDYQVVTLRPERTPSGSVGSLDVVAVRADGQERLLARLSADAMPAGFVLGDTGVVSKDGWLAVGSNSVEAVALIDLRDGSTRTRIEGDPVTMAWGPDGRIAIRGPQGIGLSVVDPDSGDTIRLNADGPFGVDRRILWAADGSGLVGAGGDPAKLQRPDSPPDWKVLPLDGQSRPGFVPVYDAMRRSPDSIQDDRASIAGDRLVLCPPGLHAMFTCRASAGYELGRQDATGALTILDVTPSDGQHVDDVMFAAGDRGMWLLRDDPAEGRYFLDRLDERAVVTRTLGAPMPPGGADSRLASMAPDDSIVQVSIRRDDPDVTEWYLWPTDGTLGTYHEGSVAGYLSSSVADTIGDTVFRRIDGPDVAAVSRAPTLPSSEQLDGYAAKQTGVTGSDPVLLRDEGPLGSQPATTVVLEPFTQPAGHRMAIQFACAGPGTIEVDLDGQSVGAECMADDSSWGFFDPIAAPTEDRVVSLQVTIDSGAAWRIAAYDLGP